MTERVRGPRIGVDAMGGDSAPRIEVEGAVMALREDSDSCEVVLVGDKTAIEAELKRFPGWESLPLRIVHAPERIEMTDSAVAAVRRKRNSSLGVAMRLHKQGAIDAVISAGNTGAAVATSFMQLGPLEGVDRPAIAAVFPFPGSETGVVVLDVGATKDCRPLNLLQFGVMGTMFARHVMGVKRPRVGLLNIGEEPNKGNELVREAYELLSQAPDIDFVGNIEGRAMIRCAADVVVCDGFTGNVVLKVSEALVEMFKSSVRKELSADPLSLLGGLLARPAFNRLKSELDYAEYGGAPLLGVNGVVLISHGSSSARAICNAIHTACVDVTHQVNAQIRQELKIAHA